MRVGICIVPFGTTYLECREAALAASEPKRLNALPYRNGRNTGDQRLVWRTWLLTHLK